MLKASSLRVGNKFKSCFGQVQTVLSIIDNTRKGEIKVCADCPDDVPHFKSENHRDMYSHLILCEENGNQYKPFEIEGEPLTEEWLIRFRFHKDNYGIKCKTKDDTYTSKSKAELWTKRCKQKGVWVYDISIGEGFGETTPVCFIKYVHELQNLYFAITGKELILEN